MFNNVYKNTFPFCPQASFTSETRPAEDSAPTRSSTTASTGRSAERRRVRRLPSSFCSSPWSFIWSEPWSVSSCGDMKLLADTGRTTPERWDLSQMCFKIIPRFLVSLKDYFNTIFHCENKQTRSPTQSVIQHQTRWFAHRLPAEVERAESTPVWRTRGAHCLVYSCCKSCSLIFRIWYVTLQHYNVWKQSDICSQMFPTNPEKSLVIFQGFIWSPVRQWGFD